MEVRISHSVQAGTSDSAEEAGTTHSADPDTSNSADAGTSHSADAGNSQIIVKRSRLVKFTAEDESVEIEADEGEKPLKQPRTEFCKCKSKCDKKPYCAENKENCVRHTPYMKGGICSKTIRYKNILNFTNFV